MKIGYGIVTINRPGGFIHPMIQSLRQAEFFSSPENLPLLLSVGTDDAAHLALYRDLHEDFRIREISRQEMEAFRFDEISRGARCSLGHYWCMKGMLEESFDALAVFEDDVVFAKGWIPRLNAAIEDIRKDHEDNWVMSLYTSNWDVKYYYEKKRLWFPLEKDKFFGSQAILYPRRIAEEFMPYLEQAIDGGRKAADMALAKYTIEKGIPLVSITPCLVEHIGNISVGCNLPEVNFHRAGLFMDSI
jgi:GR25 family glycosyltransferase involved in LPS biosynthesis